jgi:hypothetical protein
MAADRLDVPLIKNARAGCRMLLLNAQRPNTGETEQVQEARRVNTLHDLAGSAPRPSSESAFGFAKVWQSL